jgi:filamentous hemagglutinin family protein
MIYDRVSIVLAFGLAGIGVAAPAWGQIEVTAVGQPGATGTTVSLPIAEQVPGSQVDINGGQSIQGNLFHSFQQFSTQGGQTTNFLTNPGVQNVLVRVGNPNPSPSILNGLIQVTGSNANLFLMNPAGILFGPNASLNLPGSFLATTANGIRFGDNGWFNAVGEMFIRL